MTPGLLGPVKLKQAMSLVEVAKRREDMEREHTDNLHNCAAIVVEERFFAERSAAALDR